MSFNGYYLPRSGEQANIYVDPLLQAPEFPLDQQEMTTVYQYENNLFDRPIAEQDAAPTVGEVLQGCIAEDIDAPAIFTKPLLDGRVHTADMPAFTGEGDVYAWLAATAQAGGQDERLLELSKQAMLAYKQELGAEIAAGKTAQDIDPAIIAARPVVVDPQDTLRQFDRLQQVRQLLRAEYKAVRAEEGTWDIVADAKCAILEIYLAKTNGLIANYLPRIGYIQDQAAHIGDHQTWLQASKFMPNWHMQTVMIMQETRRRFYTRLDYIQNGMGIGATGQASPIPAQLWELSQAEEGAAAAADIEPVFNPEETRRLKEAMITPEDMVSLYAEALRRAGLLSDCDPITGPGTDKFDPKRKVRASDGKWQVVKSPNKDSFVVESEPGTMQVPSMPRSLYEALVVGRHELRHVDQGEADAAIARFLKIAKLKGRRVSMLREGGGMQEQRAAALEWFGEVASDRPEMEYGFAIERLRANEGPVAAAIAFYNEFRVLNPEVTAKDAGERAADRVVRLMRAEETNSQPMSYSEDSLANAALQESSLEARARSMRVVCFDLPDQVRLHRFGLLPLPPEPEQNLGQILLDVARPYIERALAAA